MTNLADTVAAQQMRHDDIDEPTRWLCSWVLRRPSVAEAVFTALCIPRTHTLAPSPGMDLITLGRHAEWAIDDERNVVALVLRRLVGAGVVLVLAVANVVRGGSWWLTAIAAVVLFVILGGAVVLPLTRAADRHERARAVMAAEPTPADDIGLVRKTQWEKMESANTANVLVYPDWRGERGTVTSSFPGYGRLAAEKVVDHVTGTQPLAFTADRLLKHLARNLAGPSRLVLHLPGDRVEPMGHDVRPSPDNPHDLHVNPDAMDRLARTPNDRTRVYVTTEATGEDGQLVTSLHVSAVTGPKGLTLTLLVHLLHPVWPQTAEASKVPIPRAKQIRGASRDPETWLPLRHPLRERKRLRRLVRAAGSRTIYDPRRGIDLRRRHPAGDLFSPAGPIRFAASLGTEIRGPERLDIERHMRELVQDVFDETAAFLRDVRMDDTGVADKGRAAANAMAAGLHDDARGLGDLRWLVGNLGTSVGYLENGDPPPADGTTGEAEEESLLAKAGRGCLALPWLENQSR